MLTNDLESGLLQTVRRTDEMRSQDRALHYSASRGKNTPE